jgi:hypothetical protein
MKWFEGLTWETRAGDVGWVWIIEGLILVWLIILMIKIWRIGK